MAPWLKPTLTKPSRVDCHPADSRGRLPRDLSTSSLQVAARGIPLPDLGADNAHQILIEKTVMSAYSVVIPTFNRRATVLHAVNSVVAQSRPAQSIIVVDDGSTDGTEELFASHSAQVQYIRTPNSGVSAARNVGIRACDSPWVAFLDSDDTWHPEKMQLQFEALEQTSANACYTRIASDDGTEANDVNTIDSSLSEGESRAYQPALQFFSSKNHPMVQTLLIRLSLVREFGGFDEKLAVAEDTKLFYQVLMSGGFAYVNKTLASLSRRRTGYGLSDDPSMDSMRTRYAAALSVQEEFFQKLQGVGAPESRFPKSRIPFFLRRCAEIACVSGDMEECQALSIRGLKAGGVSVETALALYMLLFPKLRKVQLQRRWNL